MNKIIRNLKPTSKYVIKRLKTITPFESFILISLFALTLLLVKYFKIKETEIKVRLQVWDYPWPNEVNPFSHRMPHWKADQFRIGQVESDSRGKPIARVLGVQKYNGNSEGSEVYLTVKLRVDYNKVTHQYTFKNKTIDLGGFVELKMANIFITGKVINNDISKNKNQEIEMKTVWRNLRLRSENTPFWIASKLSIGQKALDPAGETIAEITNVERYEQSVETSDVFLDVKLRTTYDEKSQQYLFDNKTLNISNLVALQLNNVAINPQVVDDQFPDGGYKKKEVIVTAKWAGIEQWQINQMKVGEKMLNQSNNETVAEILSIHPQIFPNNVFTYKDSGEVSIVPHQTKKDVIFKIKFNAFEFDNKLFFAGHQRIKAGDSVTIFGKNLTYYVIIQSVDQVIDVTDKK